MLAVTVVSSRGNELKCAVINRDPQQQPVLSSTLSESRACFSSVTFQLVVKTKDMAVGL